MKCLCYFVVCCSLMGNLLAFDGKSLLRQCHNSLEHPIKNPTYEDGLADGPTYEDGLADGNCASYVLGTIDTALMWHVIVDGSELARKHAFCLPIGFTRNYQAIQAAIKYLEDHPAELHKDAAILVQSALKEAFPCPRPSLGAMSLDAGADVNAKDNNGVHNGQTALILAVRLGHTDVVRTLLDAGADVNAKDNDGQTALWEAAYGGHTDIVEILRAAGAEEPER